MADGCLTPEYTDGQCHCASCDSERARADRIENYYQQSAWDLAERIVDLEDELGADVDGICTGMHADVAEAHAEVDRLKRDLRVSEAKVGGAALYVDRVNVRVTMLENVVDAYDGIHGERDRYRSAWLSARRRAADEANLGMEALERKEREVSRWRSGHETAEAQLVWERRDNARLRAFADEAKQVHYRCRDGEPDCAERFLRAIYDSMYELWAAEREKRPFVDRVHRRAARGEFDEEPLRKSTPGAPRLEHMGSDEDGEVWRLEVSETRP
jgi:hypothetical protein